MLKSTDRIRSNLEKVISARGKGGATEPKVRFSPKGGTDFNKINILSSQRIAVWIKSGFDAGRRTFAGNRSKCCDNRAITHASIYP